MRRSFPSPTSRCSPRPTRRRVGTAGRVLCRGLVSCGLLLGSAALAGSAGCEAMGAMAYKFSGAPEIPAAYVPAKTPMLVLVEKADNPGEVPLEAEQIARLISVQLQEHHVAPLVDPSPLATLRSRDPERYRLLSATEAGRLTAARQVLYVDLTEFTVADAMATELVRGRIAARIKVIDVPTGHTLWPQDTTQGVPMSVDDPYARTGSNQTAGVLRQKMCQALADKIGRLFYKYKSEQVDSTEPPAGDLSR